MALASDGDLRARREAIIREHVAAENRHDTDGVVATFQRPRYDVVPLGQPHDGPDAVRELLAGLFQAFPDFHVEAGPMFHADDAVFTEALMTGTHQAEWAGIPATGRRMDVRVGCLFEFEADGLTCERVYFDFATLLRQLGALP
jgi:steroid delta-isomerase-like uncharacterized protein